MRFQVSGLHHLTNYEFTNYDLRIISGNFRGKRIIAPKSLPVRPTTDFAKEGLFNILDNNYEFNNIKVLDLFSGTGNISYEFASRGTKNITAIDNYYECINFINKTAQNLNFEQLNAIKTDALFFLDKYYNKYDVIFADPPFDYQNLNLLIEKVFENMLLEEDGVFILEHNAKNKFDDNPHFYKHKKYGAVNFTFFM